MSKRSLVWLVCAIIVTVSVGTFSVYRIIRHSGAPDIPACVAVPAEDDRQLTLIFTGDLMQHLPQVQAAFRRDGGIDYTACFSRLKNYFASADFVIANLETTLGGEPYSGYPQFRPPGALAGAMRRVGIDVAVAANNHICDRGGAGIRSTLDTLVQAGLEYTGVFADTLPDPARHPLWLRKGDFRVALLNYTYGTNGLSVPRGYTVNRIDTLRIRQDIAGARGNGATHVVLFLHWGNEYETLPNRWQRDLAARSHRWGADLVIGSHPHVVQSVETVSDSSGRICGATVFSMGNFVSNQRFPGTDGGISVRIGLSLGADGRTAYRPEYLIHWTSISSDPGSRSGHRYEIVPAYSRETVSPQQRPGLDRFVRRTRDYMQRYSRGFTEITDDYRKSGDAGTLPGD